MDVTGNESSFKTTGGSVQNDTPRNEEGRETVIHTGEGSNSGGSSKQKHRGYDDICQEAEDQECNVRRESPACLDNLTDGMGRRSNFLERDGQNSMYGCSVEGWSDNIGFKRRNLTWLQ